ncbi:hypothetical protein CVT26_004338 [Gymnopilus dilepis]|uniref:Uncharacterized protein n=1 Tax=Gymnopilus dilepis TaxID=231916 RepID=A0A409W288_9AGAR|nr:hypothetical protein CVT26_004338 [Gymnopilus dilepis]
MVENNDFILLASDIKATSSFPVDLSSAQVPTEQEPSTLAIPNEMRFTAIVLAAASFFAVALAIPAVDSSLTAREAEGAALAPVSCVCPCSILRDDGTKVSC